MKICITGYRPSKLPARYGYNINSAAYQNLAKAIRCVLLINVLECQDPNLECISGMALGVDQLFVSIADWLKKNQTYAWLSTKITAAVPCRGQEVKWPVPSREQYHKLLALCDDVHFVTNTSFTPSCMEDRNRWMVDRSDAVIAVWDGKSGGTANCIRYAKQNKKTIYYIDPETLTVRREAND